MERFTNKREAWAQRKDYENRIANGYPRNIPEERFLRLAAYEDTGLMPEEIAARRWIPVTERLPGNEEDVLIAFTRQGLRGDIYKCVGMAFHTDGKTNTEDTMYSWELDNIDMEYDEEADAYIIPEGWWETVNFGENFTAVDMPVTHWMPLPNAPEVKR